MVTPNVDHNKDLLDGQSCDPAHPESLSSLVGVIFSFTARYFGSMEKVSSCIKFSAVICHTDCSIDSFGVKLSKLFVMQLNLYINNTFCSNTIKSYQDLDGCFFELIKQKTPTYK